MEEDPMTPESKKSLYWTAGIMAIVVVAAVVAYMAGAFGPVS